MEFGDIYKRNGKTEKAIQRIEEAYLIYKSYFGINAI